MGKKKSGEEKVYTTGNKKWLVILGVLVFLVIAVVIILMVIPANTSGMIETLQTTADTSFLKNQDERDKYEDFQNKIKNNSIVKYYSEEMSDIIIISDTLSDVMVYYNDFIAFADQNNVMKDNYKGIDESLKNAQENQKNLNNILTEIARLTETAASYLQNAMIDLRTEYYNWLNNYQQALERLSKCYEGCFKESVTSNLASTTILNTINDYVDVIKDEFKVIVSSDVKSNLSSSNYNYKSHNTVLYFESFVDNYISNKSEIRNYTFDKTIQEKYEKISKFFELYEENNFYEVLASISSSSDGVISKVYSGVNDKEGLYNTVKDFLDCRG